MREVEGWAGLVLVALVLAGIVAAGLLVLAWGRVVLMDRWRRETPQTAILERSQHPGRVDGSPFTPDEWDQLRRLFPRWPKED